jgi:uncharacterized glyoxalase superfamily protein PhnB
MTPIIPYLFYEDVGAAVAWLGEAFGFVEMLRHTSRDGTVTHAEMTFDGDSVMLGHVGQDYRSPEGVPSAFVFILVADVDAHFAQACRAGARILAPPADKPYGQRQYTAADPEGHHWSFSEQVRDLLPEEWGAVQTTPHPV